MVRHENAAVDLTNCAYNSWRHKLVSIRAFSDKLFPPPIVDNESVALNFTIVRRAETSSLRSTDIFPQLLQLFNLCVTSSVTSPPPQHTMTRYSTSSSSQRLTPHSIAQNPFPQAISSVFNNRQSNITRLTTTRWHYCVISR